MSTCRKITLGLLLILGLSLVPNGESRAQGRKNRNTHTFAPLPPLMERQNLSEEGSQQIWEELRRDELLQLFRDHVYGNPPREAITLTSRIVSMNRSAKEGKAILKQVEITLEHEGLSRHLNLLLFLPADSEGPVPLFLGLNFYGNQTVSDDPEILLAEGWVGNNEALGIDSNRATEASRGVRSSRWPLELILSRGYGLATLYAGDIDPDLDDGFKNGVHALFPEVEKERGPGTWGTLAAWAWGLSRVMDYLEQDPETDASRVAVIGHSRMGKAALWAGASDPRFALVISNNSGCGGAALSRRAFGERVHQINEQFPHWFASRFHTYNHREEALPVDQHMLMALVAPRPLYVASAVEDEWADPYGEYLSLYEGSPVYTLYGNPPMKSDRLPGVDEPLRAGLLAYHIRTGGHDLTRYDWEQYLDFADQWLRQPEHGSHVNPVSEEWLREHLAPSPRLVLTTELETTLRRKIQEGDKLTNLGYNALLHEARSILEMEPLTYHKQGRRLLGVSREALRRMTTLALAYRLESDPAFLSRLEEELESVCGFGDWNPSHFLDVAEMAAGVALAIDWTGEWLSPETLTVARQALVEKALEPAVGDTANTWWVTVHHNWNLVCHGGVSLAAIAVFEEAPELAARVLHQAVEYTPLGLTPYAPSGVYPEGPSYWFYATSYITLAIQAYETSLGTDFGFTAAPGFLRSAMFSRLLAGPSGEYYNYFDASLEGFESPEHFGLLCWFADRTGEGVDLQRYRDVLGGITGEGRERELPRLFPVYFLYTAALDAGLSPPSVLPDTWVGWGEEPVAVLRETGNGTSGFYLAAKGGRAADNHGNMDAGSFIFELNGVRWSVDPGNQSYFQLEQIMGQGLWETDQDSPRWSLLTKNNLGHSTLTINDRPYLVEGRATLLEFDNSNGPARVTFDLTPVFGTPAGQVKRSFVRLSDHLLIIRDDVEFSPETNEITWQMITTAEVMIRNKTVYLRQDGKQLALYLNTREPAEIRSVSLDPPPLPYDKRIPGLKRIEMTWDREAFNGPSATIEVELNDNVYQRR
ncbi:MAG: glucuronyl esterase domain-containing protein [Bacteroidales bacterium]